MHCANLDRPPQKHKILQAPGGADAKPNADTKRNKTTAVPASRTPEIASKTAKRAMHDVRIVEQRSHTAAEGLMALDDVAGEPTTRVTGGAQAKVPASRTVRLRVQGQVCSSDGDHQDVPTCR